MCCCGSVVVAMAAAHWVRFAIMIVCPTPPPPHRVPHNGKPCHEQASLIGHRPHFWAFILQPPTPTAQSWPTAYLADGHGGVGSSLSEFLESSAHRGWVDLPQVIWASLVVRGGSTIPFLSGAVSHGAYFTSALA